MLNMLNIQIWDKKLMGVNNMGEEQDKRKYYTIEGISHVYIEKGNHLFYEGDKSGEMFVINKGQVKVYIIRENKEIILDIMNENQFLGEMSLLEGEPRSASVVAMQHTELMIIDRSSLIYAIRKLPELGVKIMKALSYRLRKSNAVICNLHLKINELENRHFYIEEEKDLDLKIKD